MQYGLSSDGRKCGPVDPERVNDDGWTWYDTEGERDDAVVVPLEALRQRKDAEIKEYALSLMQSRIPALDSFAMVAFLKTIWPTLTDPTSQPDLDYCREVYEHAMTRLDQLSTADRETIEGYDPAEDTGWP